MLNKSIAGSSFKYFLDVYAARLNRQTFEVSTLNYESDRKIIESIIEKVEWGLHDKSALEIGEPSKYFGWTFFTVSIDVAIHSQDGRSL